MTLFDLTGVARCYTDGATLFEHRTGRTVGYIADDSRAVCACDGQPLYWIDGNYLHPYAGGAPLYEGDA
jgi:hypothetical protein